MTSDVIRGLLLALGVGVVVEMPIGPVALICIRQAIVVGPLAGLVTAVIPALADSLYGALGIVGSRVPLTILAPHRTQVQLAVGLLLVALGLYFAYAASRPPQVEAPAAAVARGIVPVLVLAFSNPGALVVAAAIYASLGVHSLGFAQYPFVVVAMFVGAMAWWTFLAAVAARVRRRATATIIRAIYVVCALIFVAAGVASIIGAH